MSDVPPTAASSSSAAVAAPAAAVAAPAAAVAASATAVAALAAAAGPAAIAAASRPQGTAAAPAEVHRFDCVRLKSFHKSTWHLWDVLPDPDSGKGKELKNRAPAVVEEHKRIGTSQGSSNTGLIDVLRCYCTLGIEQTQHTILSKEFWAPLSGLQHADRPLGEHFSYQLGNCRDFAGPGAIVGSYVIAMLAPGEYAVALVAGYDASSRTYCLLHTPSAADHEVLQLQHAKAGTRDGKNGTDESKQPEAAEAGDGPTLGDSLLRPRYYGRVPAGRLAPYPGRSMVTQYVKGQEVLARWEAEVTLTEPTPPNNLRPRKTWKRKEWTSFFYPAEIVGGSGLEHVTVRYLQGSDPDAVLTVHKKDVTLAPDKGEPDEAERKRQRKARKKREEERKQREDAKAAAGAAAVEPLTPALPIAAVSKLATVGSVGIPAAPGVAHAAKLVPFLGSRTQGGGSAGKAGTTATGAGAKRGRPDAEANQAGKHRKVEPGTDRRSPLPGGAAPVAGSAPFPSDTGKSPARPGSSTNEGTDLSPEKAANGSSRRSPFPGDGASKGRALPPPPAPPPPPAVPGSVRYLCSFSMDGSAAGIPAAVAPAAAEPPPPWLDVEDARQISQWRIQLGLAAAASMPTQTRCQIASTAAPMTESGASGALRFALSRKKRAPVRIASATSGFRPDD